MTLIWLKLLFRYMKYIIKKGEIMKKNSYISKLFGLLSILLSIVAILMSISIYNYSQNVVGNEIVILNNSVLKQVSENVSWVIDDAVTLCNNIAYDSRLIELLDSSQEKSDQSEENMETYVENMIDDYIWSQNNHKTLFQAYVIGYNGVNYSTDYPKYNVEDIYSNPKYEQSFMANGDRVLINTFQDPTEKGVYRYVFQVVREIRDHITKEPCGFVILNVSEKVLYDAYNELISDYKKIVLVDENGFVISSKDKRQIGDKYIDLPKVIDEQYKKSGYSNEDFSDKYMIFFDRIQGTQWYIIEKMESSAVLQPLKNIKLFILSITIICIAIFFILSRYFATKTSEPIINIRNKMEQVTDGNLDVRVNVKNNDEFGQIANSFNEMVQQIDHLLKTVKDEESKKRLAELDLLRAQINPHFIYNTLSSIRFYVEMDKNKEAEEMLFYFSKILRKTISRSDEFVTLRDELKTIDDYVKLQKLRYTDDFEVVYDISEDILDLMIPTFILQPVVENSIFYSIGTENIGIIKITGRLEDDKIKIIISDNGIGMSKKQIDNAFNKEIQVNKVGLINVNERIQLNYGSDYGLSIVSNNGKGTKIIFTLLAKKI